MFDSCVSDEATASSASGEMIFVAGASTASFNERTRKSTQIDGCDARHARNVRRPGSLPIVNVLVAMPCAFVGPLGFAAKVPGLDPGLTTVQLTNSPATGAPSALVARTCRSRDSGRPGAPTSVDPASATRPDAAMTVTWKSTHTVGAEARHARKVRDVVSLPSVNVLRVTPCASVGPVWLAANVPGLAPGLTTLQLTSSPATAVPAASATRTCSSLDSGRPGEPLSVEPTIDAIVAAPATTVKSAQTVGSAARHARSVLPPASAP